MTEKQVCVLSKNFPRKCFRISKTETGHLIEVSFLYSVVTFAREQEIGTRYLIQPHKLLLQTNFARKKRFPVSVVWSNLLSLISSHEYSQKQSNFVNNSIAASPSSSCFQSFLLMFDYMYLLVPNVRLPILILALLLNTIRFISQAWTPINRSLVIKSNSQQTHLWFPCHSIGRFLKEN